MNNNSVNLGTFNRAAVGVLFAGYILYITPRILSGGLIGTAVLLPLVLLLCWFLLSNSKKIWPVLIFAVASGCWLSMPILMLNKLLMTHYLLYGTALFMFLERVFLRQVTKPFQWYDRLMVCVAVGITLVFIKDRPGALMFGSATLGLARALKVVLGVWGYFIIRRIVTGNVDWKLQVKWLLPLMLAVFAYGEYVIFSEDVVGRYKFLGPIYSAQSWGLFSALLAMICAAPVFRKWRYYLCCFSMLMLGLVTIHRSRIIFAAFAIVVLSAVSKKLKYAAAVFVVCVMAGMGLIGVFGQRIIPDEMLRAASVFLPVDTTAIGISEQEAGLKSDFRTEMYRFAWKEIKERPLAGKGFSQNVEDAKSLYWIGIARGAFFESTAFMGGYHNYYVTLTVACGVVVGVLYFLLSLFILGKFFMYCRRLIPQHPHSVFAWAVLGYSCHLYGMILANGIEPEFVTQCVCMGLMSGIMAAHPVKSLQSGVAACA